MITEEEAQRVIKEAHIEVGTLSNQIPIYS